MSPRPASHAFAAFCEEFDEHTNAVIPDTRRVANVSAKRSRPELVPSTAPAAAADGASDSGYSSRTAATVGSGDSFASDTGSPTFPPLAPAASPAATVVPPREIPRDHPRLRDRLDEKEKDRAGNKAREKKDRKDKEKEPARQPPPPLAPLKTMPAASPRSSSKPPAVQRSSSKSHKRDSIGSRHPPGACWECDQWGYHPTPVTAAGVDPRMMDSSGYFQPLQAHQYDIPPSPQTSRYAPVITQEMHPASPVVVPQQRTHRSNSYHTQRPVSYHAGTVPDMNMMYMPMGHAYGHGPPLSASAYANSFYPPSPYMTGEVTVHQSTKTPYEATPRSSHERPRERPRTTSIARSSTEKPTARRPSVYKRPIVEYNTAPATPYEPEDYNQRTPQPDQRARRQSRSYDPDEDYYRMPPPSNPPPKPKQPTQVIPINAKRPAVRKSSTTTSIPPTHRPDAYDMADMHHALPPRMGRRDSRDPMVEPERRPSVPATARERVRTSAYYDSGPRRIVVENSRRRRSSLYNVETPHQNLEQKQREAEEYQSRTQRSAPLTAEALRKVRSTHQQKVAAIDSDSDDTSSESSHESDTQTKNGSGVGSGPGSGVGSGPGSGVSRVDDDSITMIFRGIKIDLSGGTMDKRINLRSGEEGSIELNIEGKRGSQKYLMSRSDTTSVAGSRREFEEVRRIREDSRSERESRHSSRSGYSGRGMLD
ncbi:hypothetical protein LOZ10_006657 [Ophidiomyces ophidiicola]|nr:hypothetical protein LOZ10_006657 [Ophidiomyces ophidiicola]